MKQPSKASELFDSAVETSIISSPISMKIESQAAILIDEERGLIDLLTPIWQVQAVCRLIRLKRKKMADAGGIENQFMLPGFERIPLRITIRDGKRRPLEDATYRQLAQYLHVLRRQARDNSRIQQLQALMGLVRPYMEDNPGITVKEVCLRESRKAL